MYVNTFFVFTLFLKTAAKVRPFLNIHNIFTHFFAQNCTKPAKVCKNNPLFCFFPKTNSAENAPSRPLISCAQARNINISRRHHPSPAELPRFHPVSFVFFPCFSPVSSSKQRRCSSDAAVLRAVRAQKTRRNLAIPP